MDNLWHHGERQNDKMLLRLSGKSEPVLCTIPTEIEQIRTIEDALAYILDDHNLQRISGFADKDGRFHRWSFSNRCGIIIGEYFFDNDAEVIRWAQGMLGDCQFSEILKDIGISSIYWMRKLSSFDRSQILYSMANNGKLSRKFVMLYLKTFPDL